MDWCIDSRIGGATEALIEQLEQHLARRSRDADGLAASGALARASLDRLTPGPHWVRLTWDADAPLLEVSPARLDDGVLPGEPAGAGLSRAHREADRTRPAGVAAVRISLPASRPAQPDLDPVRLDGRAGLAPEAFVAGVAATVASRTGRGMTASAAAGEAGLAAAVAATAGWTGTAPATPADVAEAFVAYHRAAGGDPVVEVADERTAVIVNHRCPFGRAVDGVPELCRTTSALLGATAVRMAGPVNVVIDESLGFGDPQCRFHLSLDDAPVAVAHRYRGAEADDAARSGPFRIDLTIRLPRDRMSVPVIRHLVQAELTELGVVGEDVEDVALALTEACTNVIDHAGPGASYDVVSAIGPDLYEIQVIDLGRGFDHTEVSSSVPGADDETGRGLALMHALMDDVSLTSADAEGTVVSLRKRLRFRADAPAAGLVAARPDGRGRLAP